MQVKMFQFPFIGFPDAQTYSLDMIEDAINKWIDDVPADVEIVQMTVTPVTTTNVWRNGEATYLVYTIFYKSLFR